VIAQAKAVLSAVAGPGAGCMRRRGRLRLTCHYRRRVDAELAPVPVADHCEILLSVGFSTRLIKKIASHGQIRENGIIPIIEAASLWRDIR
jgi:hypothetical protein